jgi:catechol 2,3-dioxygenase-like lactoylglutathione lyase family enzyme
MHDPNSRRAFLQHLGAAIVMMHVPVPLLASVRPPRTHRLAQCELRTGASLDAMRAFYGDRLGLPIAQEGTSLAIRAGDTRILFVHDPAGGQPFYHFAFNIPENKIRQARDWQLERSALLPIPERNRASGYPPEVVDYSHWNAHSIFFLDPAGNVVEYIARHDLKNADNSAFSWTDILYASEIALVVDDVEAEAARLATVADVTQYKGATDQFTAMGDEYGLLLVMKRGRVVDFTSNPHNGVRVYRTGVTVRGPKTTTYTFADYPYQLGVEERCNCA